MAPLYPHRCSLLGLLKDYCKELDSMNDKRERLIRASRDITQASKKLIFMLHRILPETKEEVIRKARQEHDRITKLIGTRVAKEVSALEGPRYKHAFSPCVQEYVEASLLLHFLEHGTLLSLPELEKQIHSACETAEATPITLGLSDFILGAADLAGELNRVIVSAAGRGDLLAAKDVRNFLLTTEPLLYAVPFHLGNHRLSNDLDGKRRTLSTSITKAEKTCFDLTVRRAEFSHREKKVLVRDRENDEQGSNERAKRLRSSSEKNE